MRWICGPFTLFICGTCLDCSGNCSGHNDFETRKLDLLSTKRVWLYHKYPQISDWVIGWWLKRSKALGYLASNDHTPKPGMDCSTTQCCCVNSNRLLKQLGMAWFTAPTSKQHSHHTDGWHAMGCRPTHLLRRRRRSEEWMILVSGEGQQEKTIKQTCVNVRKNMEESGRIVAHIESASTLSTLVHGSSVFLVTFHGDSPTISMA